MSLRDSAVSGVKWSGSSQVARAVLTIATTAILARLLVPSDFGLMAMTLGVMAFVQVLQDVGIGAALVQRAIVSDDLLSSAFWANLVMGTACAGLVVLAAPSAALFYREPRVTPLLQYLGIVFIVRALGIAQRSLLERDMRFRSIGIIDTCAAALGAVSAIASAFLGLGVWSLAVQMVAMEVTATTLNWAVSGWRPRLRFVWSELRPVLSFSLNLTGFQIVNYLARNADNLLIGRYLGSHDLGYYSLAYQIMFYPLLQISRVINRVMFPVFSRMQDDDARLRQVYVKVAAATAIVTLPMSFGVWAVADPFVVALLGAEWQPVAVLVLILAPVGALQSVGMLRGLILLAKGRTDIHFRWGIVSTAVVLAAFVLGLRWGVIGVAACYAAAIFLLEYPAWHLAFRLIGLRVPEMLAVLARTAAACLIMALVVASLRLALFQQAPAATALAILVPIGVVVYAVALCVLDPKLLRTAVADFGLRLARPRP